VKNALRERLPMPNLLARMFLRPHLVDGNFRALEFFNNLSLNCNVLDVWAPHMKYIFVFDSQNSPKRHHVPRRCLQPIACIPPTLFYEMLYPTYIDDGILVRGCGERRGWLGCDDGRIRSARLYTVPALKNRKWAKSLRASIRASWRWSC
jgi:hypothetical protein